MPFIKAIAFGLLFASQVVGADTSTLSLQLTVLTSDLMSGDRVGVRVTTKNISDHPMTYHNLTRFEF